MIPHALTRTLALLTSTRAHAACEEAFYAPAAYTESIEDVEVRRYAITSVVAGGASTRLVTISVRVKSASGAAYADAWGTIDGTTDPAWVTIVDGDVGFTTIPSTGLVLADDSLQVRVPTARMVDLRSFLTAGGWDLALDGSEMTTYGPDVFYVDQDTDLAHSRVGTIGDGRTIQWFAYDTGLLASLNPGDTLMPMPDQPSWTGLETYTPVNLPHDEDACDDFPWTVEEIWYGDGTNGGDPGEVGIVIADTRPDPRGLVATARLSAILYSFEVPDFTYDASAATGTGTVGPVGAQLDVIVRGGLVDAASLVATADLSSQLAVLGTIGGASSLSTLFDAGVALTADTADVAPYQFNGFVAGFTRLSLDGTASADTEFGSVRSDTVAAGFTYDAVDGLVPWADAWPTSTPVGSAWIGSGDAVDLTARVETDLSVWIYETSGLIDAQASPLFAEQATLLADPGDDPWWSLTSTVEAGVDGDATLELAGGVYVSSGPPWTLSEVVASATEGDAPGPVGANGRWAYSVDFDGATATNFQSRALAPGPDGTAYVSGRNGNWTFNGLITRLDDTGAALWSLSTAAPSADPQALAPLSDGSVIVGFDSCKSAARIDASGAVLWHVTISMPSMSTTCNATPFTLPDGTEGAILSSGVWFDAATATRVDADGTVPWSNQYGSGLDNDMFHGGQDLGDGTVIMVGQTELPTDDYYTSLEDCAAEYGDSYLLARLDLADGALIWSRSATGVALYDVTQLADGTLLAVGKHGGYYYGARHEVGLYQFDVDGNELLTTTFAESKLEADDNPYDHEPGDSAWDDGGQIDATEDGGAVFTAVSGFSTNTGVFVARLDAALEVAWARLLDPDGFDSVNDVIALGDATVGVGTTASFSDGTDTNRGWVFKLPVHGMLTHDTAGAADRFFLADWENPYDLDVAQYHCLGIEDAGLTTVPYATVVAPATSTITAASPTLVSRTR